MGLWRTDGEKLDRKIGMVSVLSLSPLSLAARSTADGTTSNDELPTALPTGVYGCALFCPLIGELHGTRDPLGWEHLQDLGLAIAISVALGHVIFLSLVSQFSQTSLSSEPLLILGLMSDPAVSDGGLACTCPATKSSPKGRHRPWLADSTIASWAWSHKHQARLCPFREYDASVC